MNYLLPLLKSLIDHLTLYSTLSIEVLMHSVCQFGQVLAGQSFAPYSHPI